METVAADEAGGGEPTPGKGVPHGVLQGWISAVISLTALGLSIVSLTLSMDPPSVNTTLPHILRIGQKDNTFIFLQPVLSTRKKAQDVEIITDIQLELRPERPADRSKRPKFWWDEVIKWKGEPEDGYSHISDPTLFMVTQGEPQQPVLSFVAEDWSFAVGTYQGTLTLKRESSQEPVTTKFCLTITDNDLKEFRDQKDPTWWFPYRNDDPDEVEKYYGCYARWSGY
ncbi:hypothetical protein [Streptomyces sp. NPDC012746]|uniref:hypothetical protein n=1 Tax=Streptomyces sp. NPDC012746 TaxID=3364845 RepID=UPI0036A084C3